MAKATEALLEETGSYGPSLDGNDASPDSETVPGDPFPAASDETPAAVETKGHELPKVS